MGAAVGVAEFRRKHFEVVSSPSDAELQEKFTCKQGSDRYMYVSVQGIQLQHDEVKAVAVVHGAACLVWQQAFC